MASALYLKTELITKALFTLLIACDVVFDIAEIDRYGVHISHQYFLYCFDGF